MQRKPTLLFHCKISKIEERLYLGDMMDAQNRTLLHKLQITHVLNMAAESPCFHPKAFTYLHVQAADHEAFQLFDRLDEVADFIDAGMRIGGVLVHCAYGISRGSSSVLAYLMKYRKMPFLEARAHVQARRSHICPNDGFVQQLKRYQKHLGIRTNIARADRLQRQAELAESIFGDVQSAQLKKKFRLTTNSMHKTGAFTGNRHTRVAGLYNKILKHSEQQDQDLADFGQLARNLSKGGPASNASNSHTRTSTTTAKRRVNLGSHTSNLDSLKPRSTSRVVEGFVCGSCGRILVESRGVLAHQKAAVIRCDRVFISKQDWMQGDTFGIRKNLICPNTKCKKSIGEVSENALYCICGFGDNPSCVLNLSAVKPFFSDQQRVGQKTAGSHLQRESSINLIPKTAN